ncbi:MAG: (d)CMP kinase [Anaerolineales bacterium]
MTIAIDGPAASGKSTLAKSLADELGYFYFDTGVMYRAVTLAALRGSIPVDNEAALTDLAKQIPIDVRPASRDDGRLCDVTLDGEDVTWEIRRPKVDANVSQVSAFRGVRSALLEQQRRIGQRGGVVMAGRDIGTVVLPDADLKIFLDTSLEERARRRHSEMKDRNQVSYQEVLASLRARDEIDSEREVAPLKPAKDAIILTSDGFQREEMLRRVVDLVHQRQEQFAQNSDR